MIAFNTFGLRAKSVFEIFSVFKEFKFDALALYSAHAEQWLASKSQVKSPIINYCVLVLNPGDILLPKSELPSRIRKIQSLCCNLITVIPGPSWARIRNWHVELAKDLDSLAQLSNELRFAIEPLSKSAQGFSCLTSLSDALKVVEISNANLILDTFHLPSNQILSLNSDIIQRISSVHLSDTPDFVSREYPGRGVLPLRAIINSLIAKSYRGYYEIEVFGQRSYRNVTKHLTQAYLSAQKLFK